MSLQELWQLLRADLIRLGEPDSVEAITKLSWRQFFNPRFTPVLFFRLARYFYLSRRLRFFSPVFTWLNVFIFGIEITARCEVGPGLFLPHTSGTVVGAAKIGSNVTIFQGATLGAKFADVAFDCNIRPVVGNNVVIGAGAKVLGGISIGDGGIIAANSLVLEDVEAGDCVIGVPAAVRRFS